MRKLVLTMSAAAWLLAAPRPADAQLLQRVCDSAQMYWCFEVLDVVHGETQAGIFNGNQTFYSFGWAVHGYWWGPAFTGVSQINWWGTVQHETSGGSLGVDYHYSSEGLTGRAEPGVPSVLYGDGGATRAWNIDEYGAGFSMSDHVFADIVWSNASTLDQYSCGKWSASDCHYVLVSEPDALGLMLAGILTLGLVGWRREDPIDGERGA